MTDRYPSCIFGQPKHLYAEKELSNLIKNYLEIQPNTSWVTKVLGKKPFFLIEAKELQKFV